MLLIIRAIRMHLGTFRTPKWFLWEDKLCYCYDSNWFPISVYLTGDQWNDLLRSCLLLQPCGGVHQFPVCVDLHCRSLLAVSKVSKFLNLKHKVYIRLTLLSKLFVTKLTSLTRHASPFRKNNKKKTHKNFSARKSFVTSWNGMILVKMFDCPFASLSKKKSHFNLRNHNTRTTHSFFYLFFGLKESQIFLDNWSFFLPKVR